VNLLLKLLAEGRVDYATLRDLGLSDLVTSIVVSRAEQLFTALSQLSDADARSTLARLFKLARDAARAAEPGSVERKLASLVERFTGSPRAVSAVMGVFRGVVSPQEAADVIVSVARERSAAAPREESEARAARVVAPREPGTAPPTTPRAVPPRKQ
jgi:hypothetical protein